MQGSEPLIVEQSHPQRSRPFSSRPGLFKLGFWGVLICAILFIVSFGVPHWTTVSGLWQVCNGSDCHRIDQQPTMFNAVRAIEIMALIFYLLSVGVELFQDVCNRGGTPTDSRAVELLTATAGTIGLIGISMFEAENQKTTPSGPSLDWALYTATAAHILALLSALMLAMGRTEPARNASSTSVTNRPSVPDPIRAPHVRSAGSDQGLPGPVPQMPHGAYRGPVVVLPHAYLPSVAHSSSVPASAGFLYSSSSLPSAPLAPVGEIQAPPAYEQVVTPSHTTPQNDGASSAAMVSATSESGKDPWLRY